MNKTKSQSKQKRVKAKKQANSKYFDFYDDIKIDRRDIEW